MADGGLTFPKYEGWAGVKERSSTLGDIVRCLNVDFGPDGICRRPGRRIICETGLAMKVSRILEHVSLAGDRQVLVGLVSSDPAVAPAIGSVSPYGGTYQALTFPPTIRFASPEAFFWATAYKGGHTIISDPTGRLLDYDGGTLSVLEALQGLDAKDALTASRSYLWGPPLASVVVMWRNRVVAAHLRTLGISADPSDATVPPDAPTSGANVWPSSTNLDVLTQEGDEIMGIAIQRDRLACFLRRGVVVVDEDQVSPIPRPQEKQYGCMAPRSVQEIGGGYVLYLSDGVICAFDGTRSAPISEDIADTLSWVNWNQAYRAVSAHLARKTEYRLWLPMKGRTGNRLCVIFNYAKKAWRVYSGWYPFDTLARDVQPFDVTAAATVIGSCGEEILLTGDSQGRIWREDVGEDDKGTIFPAMVMFASMGEGQSIVKWADLRVETLFDGSFLQAVFLEHGNCMEQEISRILEGIETQSLVASGRLLHDDAADPLQVFGTATAWGIPQHTAEPRGERLGERGHARRLQPVLLLPGQFGGVVSPDPGGISLMELGVAPGGGRRG